MAHSMPTAAKIDADLTLRKYEWPRSRKAVFSFLSGLKLRFSGGPLSNVDFEKWAYVASLPAKAQEQIARAPSALEHFTVPRNFKYEDIWPKIYSEVSSQEPVLSTLLILDVALQALKAASEEAVSSSQSDLKRLLAELGEAVHKIHPEPRRHAEAASQYQPSDGALSKRRRVDKAEPSQSHHHESVAEPSLVPAGHRIPYTSVGALHQHKPNTNQRGDFSGSPLSSLPSNVEDFTIFRVPDAESMSSMETNADLAAMQFAHQTDIEDYALGFIPQQLDVLPDHTILDTGPGSLPEGLQTRGNQQIDTNPLRHHDTAVLCYSNSTSAQQAQLPSLTSRNLRRGITPNTDYD